MKIPAFRVFLKSYFNNESNMEVFKQYKLSFWMINSGEF